MTNVLQFKRAPEKPSRDVFLEGLVEKQRQGKILGQMTMTMTDEGSSFYADGCFTERLQFAGYTLIKALNEVSDQIAASPTCGRTTVQTINIKPPVVPRRGVPKRLASSTGFGEL